MKNAIRQDITSNDPKANLNGLTEVRHLPIEAIRCPNEEFWDLIRNDPFATRALDYVFGYVVGLIQAQQFLVPEDFLLRRKNTNPWCRRDARVGATRSGGPGVVPTSTLARVALRVAP